jgi:hypothetical protein
MSSGLEQLTLRVSKGTVVEGLARDVIRQQFQDVPAQLKSNNFAVKLSFIVILLIIIYVLVFTIPYYFYELVKKEVARDPANPAIILMGLFAFSIALVYVAYLGPTVIAMLLICLILLISLF